MAVISHSPDFAWPYFSGSYVILGSHSTNVSRPWLLETCSHSLIDFFIDTRVCCLVKLTHEIGVV